MDMPKGPMTHGGELIVRTLKKAGVEAIFALHGAHVDAIFQAAVNLGVTLIDMRHEAAVGHAAEGYARSTRKLGVAVVTAGAGFTNVISSIATAKTDHTPVLYIAGAPGTNEAETNGLQGGIDQVAIVAPLCKWASAITRAEDAPRLIAHAIRVATTAPMGPVFINLPIDLGMMPFPDDGIAIPDNLIVDTPRLPAPDLVEQACGILAGAQRPIIYVGHEAYYSDAGAALQRFAEAHSIPVFSDLAAHGLLPAGHPLYGGTGHKLAYYAPDGKPDVVLMLGARFGLFTLGKATQFFPLSAKLIHVTSDAPEIGRLRRADLGIVADPKSMLEALNAKPLVMQANVPGWAKTVQSARAARKVLLDTEAKGHRGAIHPWLAVSATATAARGHILVADGAESYHWLNDAVAQEHEGSYLTHGHFGLMGMGLGMAIGAQIAHPERRVILQVGDGAVGFNIAEFDTMARHKMPIVVIVINNHSWGASERFQQVVPMAQHIVGTQLGDADYAAVARGFGCDGMSITAAEELGPAITAALASGRPSCIDVRVDFAPPCPELGLMMSQEP